jgi:hypothetical protein
MLKNVKVDATDIQAEWFEILIFVSHKGMINVMCMTMFLIVEVVTFGVRRNIGL